MRSGRGWEPVDEILYPRNEISGTRKTLGRVQEDAVILQLIEEDAEVLVVFLGRTAKDKDVYVCKTEIQVFEDLIHETLEGRAALRRPKDIKGNSKRPKGVVIAAFGCLQGGQEFDGNLLPGQSSKMWCSRKGGGSSPVCVGLDTCPGWSEC